VLVDAPCTGTGTWRRAPELKWQTRPADLAAETDRQARILEAAWPLVRPGGRLIYATCSLLSAENEEGAEAFAAGHGDALPISVPEIWADAVGTPCPVDGRYLRLGPARHGTDGFFAAVFRRQ